MFFNALGNKMKTCFLSGYDDASFVIQQKARVLLWIQIILAPVAMGYLAFNAYRYDWQGLYLIGTIDIVFIATMVKGILLIKHNF